MKGEPPTRGRMSESIANVLQEDILDLPVGTKMPTEAQLAERFGVSRTVVREAAKLLVQRGLVTIKPGRGMTVSVVDGSIIAEQYGLLLKLSGGSFEQLLELRLVLEVEMAALASARHTEEHLADMRTANERLTAADPSSSDFLDADLAFHDVLAQASGNPFFPLAIRPINTFLRETYVDGVGYPSQANHTVHEHIEIADAIAAGDPARARFATEQHLRRIVRNRSAFSTERSGLARPS